MASESENIRKVMNLMESAGTPPLLEGWVDNLKKKLNNRLGNKERQQLANRLEQEWDTWLGQTNRQGDVADMERFMTHRIGFTDEDVDQVWSKAGFTKDGEGGEEQTSEPETDQEASAPAAKKDEYDPEEGRPIPDDLNTKLSDYGKVGPKDDAADDDDGWNVVEDDPSKYMTKGKLDTAKLFAKLRELGPKSKLKLGNKTYDLGKKNESINEDAGDPDGVLSKAEIKDLFDASAAYINDEYLYNGPQNDRDAAFAQAQKMGLTKGQGQGRSSNVKDGGNQATGRYDADEMWAILTTDFGKTKPWLQSITRKVANSDGVADMTDSDMHDLAIIAYAFLRARTANK